MADASGSMPEAPAEVELPKKGWLPKMPKIKVWTINDVVGISDSAWGRISWIAAIVGVVAIAVNFCMVVAYAAGVALDAPMIADSEGNWIKNGVNLVIGLGQVLVAGLLQLGTDFCLLFAAGLAMSKYRFTPLAAMLLWCVCAANTLEMKKDIYESIRTGRIEQAQIKEEAAAPADVVQAKAALEVYKTKALPAEQAASTAIIETSGDSVRDLQIEREEKVAARAEEAKTGRESRWQEHDARIREIDASIKTERASLATARVALAERVAYDANTAKVTAWDTRPKIQVSGSGYDSDWAITLRVWGASVLSFIAIIVTFATDKAADDLRKAEKERERRSAASKQGHETRKGKPVDAEFSEAAPLEARQLGHDPHAEAGAVAKADMGRRVKPPRPGHPDATGDNYGAQADGYLNGDPDGTN